MAAYRRARCRPLRRAGRTTNDLRCRCYSHSSAHAASATLHTAVADAPGRCGESITVVAPTLRTGLDVSATLLHAQQVAACGHGHARQADGHEAHSREGAWRGRPARHCCCWTTGQTPPKGWLERDARKAREAQCTPPVLAGDAVRLQASRKTMRGQRGRGF